MMRMVVSWVAQTSTTPAARLVIEYDGGTHRERLVEDDRRQNLLVNAGFRLLRFTAVDVYNRPEIVQTQVRGALLAPKTRYPREQARVWRKRRGIERAVGGEVGI